MCLLRRPRTKRVCLESWEWVAKKESQSSWCWGSVLASRACGRELKPWTVPTSRDPWGVAHSPSCFVTEVPISSQFCNWPSIHSIFNESYWLTSLCRCPIEKLLVLTRKCKFARVTAFPPSEPQTLPHDCTQKCYHKTLLSAQKQVFASPEW